jgi:hypothetical protein
VRAKGSAFRLARFKARLPERDARRNLGVAGRNLGSSRAGRQERRDDQHRAGA